MKARVYTELLYRHWTAWQSRRRSHLLVIPVAGGAAKDLTPGDARRAAVFARRPGRLRHFARWPGGLLSDECRPGAGHQHQHRSVRGVRSSGGEARKITATPGADASPHYSPDGKYIAWRAQFRAGYESDRWRLMVLERATGQSDQPHRDPGPLGEQLHLVARIRRSLFFTTGDRGRQAIQLISVNGRRGAHGGQRR